MSKVCIADFGRRVLGSSPKTSHAWNQRRAGRPPETNHTSLHRKLDDKKHTRMYAFYRVSKGEIPFGSAGSRSKEGVIGREKT